MLDDDGPARSTETDQRPEESETSGRVFLSAVLTLSLSILGRCEALAYAALLRICMACAVSAISQNCMTCDMPGRVLMVI